MLLSENSNGYETHLIGSCVASRRLWVPVWMQEPLHHFWILLLWDPFRETEVRGSCIKQTHETPAQAAGSKALHHPGGKRRSWWMSFFTLCYIGAGKRCRQTRASNEETKTMFSLSFGFVFQNVLLSPLQGRGTDIRINSTFRGRNQSDEVYRRPSVLYF